MMRRMATAIVVAALLVLAPALKAQVVLVKYGIVLIVDHTDTKQAVRAVLDGLDALMTGRGLHQAPPDFWYDYYVWTGTSPERQAFVVVGLDGNAPVNTLNEINKNSAAHAQIGYYGNESPEWMTWHAKRIAYFNHGAIYQYAIRPGVDLTVASPEEWLARFVPFDPNEPQPPK